MKKSNKIKDLKLSEQRLAEMWCELNRWKIPQELENYITDHSFESNRKGTEAMGNIVEIIGIDNCLVEWRKQVEESNHPQESLNG